MTNVKVFRSDMGIPLIELSGQVTERDGAELAAKVMRQIYLASKPGDDDTEHGEDEYPAEMCERVPITSEDSATAPEAGS
jgi:hypothetical protein